MIDIVEILLHWSAGRNRSQIARSLGIDRGTVAKYTAKAEAEGYAPTAPSAVRGAVERAGPEWFPELVDPRERSRTHETIDAYAPTSRQMLTTNTARRCTSAYATSMG